MSLRRIWSWLGFLLGALALVLQLWLTVTTRLSAGDNIVGALFFYITFLTILTNLQLVLSYLSDLIAAPWLGWWRLPATRLFSTGLIALVMIYYHFALSGLEHPTGLDGLLNTYMHYIAPVIFILWWLVTEPHGRVKFSDIPMMLVPLAGYLVLVFVRGAIVHEYPYPAMDVDRFGAGQVALNMLFVGLALVMIFAVLVGIDRLLGRGKTA